MIKIPFSFFSLHSSKIYFPSATISRKIGGVFLGVFCFWFAVVLLFCSYTFIFHRSSETDVQNLAGCRQCQVSGF